MALRLCDLEGLDQKGARNRLGGSRGAVQCLLKSGRETLIRVLVENRAPVIGLEVVEETQSWKDGDR